MPLSSYGFPFEAQLQLKRQPDAPLCPIPLNRAWETFLAELRAWCESEEGRLIKQVAFQW